MQNDLFEKAPVHKAYFSFALPVVFSMVISLIYNMADTYFIAGTGNTNLVAGVSLGAPFIILVYTPSNLLRTEGFAVGSMTGTVLGAVVNIILDPIFILSKTVGYYGVLSAQPVADFITAIVAIVLVRTSVYKEIQE